MSVDLELVLDALTELSDETYQRRVWCGHLNDKTSEMSSFTEARSTLFDDSGLLDALETRDYRRLGPPFYAAVGKLREQAQIIDKMDLSEEELVGSEPMERIRKYATEAKELLGKVSSV